MPAGIHRVWSDIIDGEVIVRKIQNYHLGFLFTAMLVAMGSFVIQGKAVAPLNSVFLPLVIRQEVTPSPTMTSTSTHTPSLTPTMPDPSHSDLQITKLSGTSAPEYVTIKNFGPDDQNMTGWILVSVVGPQTYTFPSGFVLTVGSTVRIESFTGAANNPPMVLLWTTTAIWNNSGDKAELRNASDQLISTACYGNGC